MQHSKIDRILAVYVKYPENGIRLKILEKIKRFNYFDCRVIFMRSICLNKNQSKSYSLSVLQRAD